MELSVSPVPAADHQGVFRLEAPDPPDRYRYPDPHFDFLPKTLLNALARSVIEIT
jgi:hypothetical protein